MITDSKQVCFVKMTGRRVQEELYTHANDLSTENCGKNCGRKLQEEAETVFLSTFRDRAWRRRMGEGKDCPVERSRLAGVIEELTLGLARNAASLFNSPCDFPMLQIHLDSQSIANFQEGNEIAVDPFFNLG